MTVSDIAAMEVEAQEKVAETKEVEAKEVEGKEVEAKEVEEASPASPDSEMKDAAEDQEGEKDGKESADDSDAANKESNDDEEKVESPAKEEDEEEKEPEVEEDNGERDEKLEDDKEEDLFPYGTQVLNDWDRTFNAMSAENKTSLTSIQADGFNNLFAGMRGTVGFHSGRYYFEIKMLDHPRMVRVGFSTLTDDLSLDSSTAFLFDSMGDVVSQGVRQKAVNPRWSRTDVVGVLLNVSMKTVTLYLNGTKTPTGQVTSLPDSMFENGKLKAALYPAIASKGSAVECNFSRKVWKDLPFKTRMVGCGRKADAVLSTKKRHSEISAEDAANTTVEVTIPVGFDSTALVEEYKKDHPDAWVLTGSELALWGEKSGLAKRGQQRGQEKWGVGCLDAPMSVFPMLLKGGNKYLMSLNTMHNLHPSQRADVMAKLRHALNVKINALVCVNSVVDVLENKKPVPQQVRDYYEHVKLPSEDEGWSSIKYSYTGEENLTQEEMGVMVNEKFTAWKKDCKLKSKVSDLRKSTYYQSQLAKFAKLKQLQHKTTAETARKNHVAQQQKMLEEKKAKKAAEKEEAKKAAEEKKAEEKKEGEEEEEEKAEEPEEEEEEEAIEELPEIMEEFAEEDWMLALLRCELHTLVHAFRKDVNDPERTSFPAIHFGHYYQLYTGKNFGGTLQNFNCKTLEELTRLVPDMCQHTVEMDDFALRREKTALLQDYDLVLPAHDDADMEVCKFIQDTEDARQMRTDRLDAGDENAALTFTYKGANVRGGQVTRTGVAQGGAVGQESFKRPIPNAQQYNDFQAKRSRGGNFQAQNASSGRR